MHTILSASIFLSKYDLSVFPSDLPRLHALPPARYSPAFPPTLVQVENFLLSSFSFRGRVKRRKSNPESLYAGGKGRNPPNMMILRH